MSVSIATKLRVEEVRDAGSLAALRPAWERLYLQCPTATPFQSPAWLMNHWASLPKGALWTQAIYREKELVGLLPAYVQKTDQDRRGTVRLIGSGISDYLGPLLNAEAESEVAEVMVGYLAECADRFDRCDFTDMLDRTALACCRCADPLSRKVDTHEHCPVLRLPQGHRELGEVIPPKQHKKLHYFRRLAERSGSMSIDNAAPEELPERLSLLFRLHRDRWNKRDEDGVLVGEKIQQFHRRAAVELAEAGLLWLYMLSIDGRPIACLYGFRDPPRPNARHYFYLSGFDTDYGKLSPGLLLVGHAIEAALAEGAGAFDFLRGGEAYKYRWGAADEPTRRIEFTSDWATRGDSI